MTDYDVIVVGSGFGGSVAALRAAEKGYRVLVVEAGRRFRDEDFPKTSWDIRNYLWAPWLRCFGIQRISLLRNVMVLSGAGVGGGSLVYANTLYEPHDDFYADPQWREITDWRDELAPHYARARRMLGVVTNPETTPADVAMRDVAQEMGVGSTFRLTPVGVLFGSQPGVPVPDPFFGGLGPSRTTCTSCGACMTGCRVGAKNTLVKNYLALAEHAGVRVRALTTVTALRPLPGGGYAVDVHPTGSPRRACRGTLTADQVVLAAGALGTQRLLHVMRRSGELSHLSPRLGELTRTNSESLLGATARSRAVDYTRGVAITSSFHPAQQTHVEAVRFGKGSNAMGLLATMLVPGVGRGPRWLRFGALAVRRPAYLLRSTSVRHWSERTVIALVMQSIDNSLTVRARRGLSGRLRLTSRQGHGTPNPTWIPEGHDAVRRLARRIDGDPGGTISEVVDVPLTAHILGGCPIGASPETGVLDPWQRVYGHPGLHVTDGAAVSANLGVNPALTITAQAERAMAFWPNRGEADPRPPVGSPYARITPAAARHPVLPSAPV